MKADAASASQVESSRMTAEQAGESGLLLEVRDVTKSFGGVRALQGASLALARGAIHAVIGHNGAGKSTMMRVLSGVVRPDSGTILLNGEEIDPGDPKQAQSLGIAMVHQELSVIDDLDIAENIMLTREPRNRFGLIDRRMLDAEAKRVLDDLGIDNSVRTKCGDLSIGERQMVEIARAVSGDASVLILDEPTAALTQREQDALFALLARIKPKVGIFYISHRLDEVMELADVVTILRDGRTVGTLNRGSFAHEDLVERMLGRILEPAKLEPRSNEGDLLTISGLQCRSARLVDLNLTVGRGEIVGLAGMLGSGRSELFECLFGLRRVDGGTIRLNGRDLRPGSPLEAMARGVALVPEDRKMRGIFPGTPLWRNISMASFRDMFSRAGFVEGARARAAAGEQVDRLGIRTPSVDQDIAFLSGGNQQKAVLARWVLRNPVLLLLDEPTAGIDIGAKSEIHSRIHDLAGSGVGILVASSEFEELIGLCHRIAVIRDGRILDVLHSDRASEQALVALATGGAK